MLFVCVFVFCLCFGVSLYFDGLPLYYKVYYLYCLILGIYLNIEGVAWMYTKFHIRYVLQES